MPIVASEVTPATAKASCVPPRSASHPVKSPPNGARPMNAQRGEPDHPPPQVVWGAELDERVRVGREERE